MVVEGNDLYIFEEADYSLHVHTISPFALKWKGGKKGEGVQDFKYLPFVFIQPDTLACTDFTKTIWFSKEGKIIKTKEYSDFENFDLSAEMLLIPVKNHFVQITADHKEEKRHVYLLDPQFKTVKELYEGSFTWKRGAPIHYRTDTLCYKGLIFISDTKKGFHITVIDDKGNNIQTIDKNQDVEEIPGKPRLHQFCVSGDNIYAVTNKIMDNKREMIILDFKGRILKRIFLPFTSIQPKRGVLRYDLFDVDKEKLYELIKNSETGKWELKITAL
jgi:hypothetical protein